MKTYLELYRAGEDGSAVQHLPSIHRAIGSTSRTNTSSQLPFPKEIITHETHNFRRKAVELEAKQKASVSLFFHTLQTYT